VSLPALPNAASVTPAQIAEVATALVAWADTVDDVAEVRDAANKWAAITEYVRRTSREGVAEAESALRRLEVRVGQLLGPASPNGKGSGSHASDPSIGPDDRSRFRAMADNADVVEDVIAASTDADPPSRRKVLHEIARRHEAAHVAEAEADLEADLDRRGINRPSEAERAAVRPYEMCEALLLGAVNEVLAHRDRYGVDYALDALAHTPVSAALWAAAQPRVRAAVSYLLTLAEAAQEAAA